MILFCNLRMCAYVHKICEEKFGSYKRSFSRLSQKEKDRHALRIFVTVILFKSARGVVHLLVRYSHVTRIILRCISQFGVSTTHAPNLPGHKQITHACLTLRDTEVRVCHLIS